MFPFQTEMFGVTQKYGKQKLWEEVLSSLQHFGFCLGWRHRS